MFARMTSSIKTLNIRTAVNASRRSNDSEWRVGSILAHHESAAHMKRQLADLREKEMRIARCWCKQLAIWPPADMHALYLLHTLGRAVQ